jgi:hypothetical protein
LVKDVEVEEKKGILDMEIDKVALKKAIGVIGRTWYFKKLGEYEVRKKGNIEA